jgi:hypothetical protein
LALLSIERYEREPERLTRRDAAALIDHIQACQKEGEQP